MHGICEPPHPAGQCGDRYEHAGQAKRLGPLAEPPEVGKHHPLLGVNPGPRLLRRLGTGAGALPGPILFALEYALIHTNTHACMH